LKEQLTMSPSQTTAGRFVQPKPLIVTAVFHGVILLLLLLWHFSLPAPETTVPEMGMEVNLGTSDNGSGTDQPMDMEDPAESVSTAGTAASSSSSDAETERSEDDESPSVATTNSAGRRHAQNKADHNRTAANTTVATTRNRNAQQQRPRYVYPGSNGKGGNSAAANMAGTNEGNTTGSGDRGVPRGTPGAANYTGSPGNGTGGISYSLSGRTMIAFPPKEAQFRAGGRVVVRVTVARDGSITNRNIRSSTNTELNSIALRKVQQVRFNASETAPEEQFGDITFVFKTRQ
jgi:TonB family protein